MAITSSSHVVTRQLFMWSMACVYLFAFISLYTQVPGLYGPRGLAPVHNVVPKLRGQDKKCQVLDSQWHHDCCQSQLLWHSKEKEWAKCSRHSLLICCKRIGDVPLLSQLQEFPSLLIFHSLLGIPPSVAMEMCCLVGAVLAMLVMIFRALRCTVMFAMLWVLYLSLYKVGQVFLWFQWDSLLLEAGFLTILVAPFNLFYWRKSGWSNTDGLTFWLVRFLLFRLMFASGIVKLTSQCPTWWGLTALNYHYESQCLPTPLSWYAHQFPEWLQKLSVVATYVIEIVMPLLFFLPVRSLRILGFLSQVFLQVLIIATGNYNFFNLLTIVLSLSLVDDRFLGYGTEGRKSGGMLSRFLRALFGANSTVVYSAGRLLSFLTISGLMAALTVYYCDISLDYSNMAVHSDITFSSEGFARALNVAVPLTTVIAALSLCVELGNSFIEAVSWPGLFSKMFCLLQTCLVGSVVITMFSVAVVSHGVLDSRFHKSIPPPITTLHGHTDRFTITNPYGLFRRMTGVGGRPEVVFEGTNGDPEGDSWKEYEFLYKPGNTFASPVYVAPHQPRLDWQMWFAALGHYSNNPWLVNLAHKLLVGEKDVLDLMAAPPFPSPPTYIRARLYHYHFTPYEASQPVFNQTRQWWRREFISEYLYALTKENSQLKEFLNGKNYLREPDMSDLDSPVIPWLVSIRQLTRELSPPLLLWGVFFTTLATWTTIMLLCPDRKQTLRQSSKVDVTGYLAEIDAPDDPPAPTGTPKAKGGPYRRRKN